MPSFAQIENFFEHFAPADIERLAVYYSEDAFFKDPFNEVHGLDAIRRIYSHMFETLESPRFIVRQRVGDEVDCFLVWDFRFRFRKWRRDSEHLVRGTSHLRLGADARIQWHRDYWDVAEEVYEKLPVLGSLMRSLKRRAAPQ